ncbi:hypothetical protein WJX72_007774 [[Myrmecia] bisecta]|uniref:Origin recognition complex subunit 6 n=1 Tax=[Myrmecia] bisecta TaxID=41462 RepID=A0AAW1PY81_9CHLO
MVLQTAGQNGEHLPNTFKPGAKRKLGIVNPQVTAKANELVRLASQKFGGGALGQGEICKQAVCFELTCASLGQEVDHASVVRLSGATEKVYNSTKIALQRGLGVKCRVGARELCVQFGCARLEPGVQRNLALYKQRFIQQLPPGQRDAADFSRSVFTAAAFFLTARKEKIKVDRKQLLDTLGIPGPEFTTTTNSMSQLIFDVTGVERKKRKAGEIKSNRALVDKHSTAEEEEQSGDENEDIEEEEGMAHRPDKPTKRTKAKEYAAWKDQVTKKAPASKGMTLEKLKQTTLSFGRASEPIV